MITVTTFPPGTPPKTAYRSISGDDSTAELDNSERPFASIDAIMAALKPFADAKTHRIAIKDVGYTPQPRPVTAA